MQNILSTLKQHTVHSILWTFMETFWTQSNSIWTDERIFREHTAQKPFNGKWPLTLFLNREIEAKATKVCFDPDLNLGAGRDRGLKEEEQYSQIIIPVIQQFSIPVLAPPCSAYFVCYSYRFRCLFYLNASALRSGHHRIFRHDSIQSALTCARRELKLYIFTEVYDVTLVRAWRRCAAQMHEWMFRNKVNFSGFPLLRE